MLVTCPRHLGAFDCTPFCNICSGEQEVEIRDPELVPEAPGRPMLALKRRNVYEILKFLNRDFGLTRNLTDTETEALRELQIELLLIATREER